MESLIEYWQFWALYAAFALAGWWCWDQLFFWIPAGSDWRRLAAVPGAVILFTPSPVSAQSDHLAPAVFVLILDVLSGVPPLTSASLLWLLGGCCAGMLILAIRQLLVRWLGRNPEQGKSAA